MTGFRRTDETVVHQGFIWRLATAEFESPDGERFYRDVRLFRLYEGTSQIQQLIIARNMIRDAS